MNGIQKRCIELGFVLTTLSTLLAMGCSSNPTNPGSGGNGNTGNGGSGGNGGGTTTACIDPKTYETILTINDAGFCVVAFYDTDFVNGSITWGRHGGPMFVEASPSKPGWADLTRLSPPEGFTTGKLVIDKKEVNASLPPGSFLGSQAVDVPFFDWTVISYTKADATSSGEVILLNGIDVKLRYPVNGFFSAAGVGAVGELGRLIYSGRSPIFKTQLDNNALYAADACGTIDNLPRLVPDGDMTCGDVIATDDFGDYSGPVAADRDGNVFAMMSYMSGEQEAKGYAGETMKRGAPATMGDTLFKMQGYAGSFAAITPDGTGTGVLLFQPLDKMTFKGLDVIAQRYTVEGGKIVPQGVAGPFMSAVQTGTTINFTTDDNGRVWVAMPRSNDYAVLVLERMN